MSTGPAPRPSGREIAKAALIRTGIFSVGNADTILEVIANAGVTMGAPAEEWWRLDAPGRVARRFGPYDSPDDIACEYRYYEVFGVRDPDGHEWWGFSIHTQDGSDLTDWHKDRASARAAAAVCALAILTEALDGRPAAAEEVLREIEAAGLVIMWIWSAASDDADIESSEG